MPQINYQRAHMIHWDRIPIYIYIYIAFIHIYANKRIVVTNQSNMHSEIDLKLYRSCIRCILNHVNHAVHILVPVSRISVLKTHHQFRIISAHKATSTSNCVSFMPVTTPQIIRAAKKNACHLTTCVTAFSSF